MILRDTQHKLVVYKLTNLNNGKVYVGQTRSGVRARWVTHVCEAKKGYHPHRPINRAIRKYGVQAFGVAVVQICKDLESLSEAEQFWIRYFKSQIPNGYNIEPGGYVGPVSELTRKQISERLTGKKRGPHSEEWKKNQSEGIRRAFANGANKGGTGPEAREKLRAMMLNNNPFKGKKHTPESLAKMREKLKGRKWPCTEKWREELRQRSKGDGNPFYGRKHSPETLAKISQSLRARCDRHSAERKAAMSSKMTEIRKRQRELKSEKQLSLF